VPDRERSRIARAARVLTGRPEGELLANLDALHVGVVLEVGATDLELAALTAVRIALLTYGRVTLVCPDSTGRLAIAARALARQIRPSDDAIEIASSVPRELSGVLRIGHRVEADFTSVTVGRDGWVVRMVAADANGAVPMEQIPVGGTPNQIGEIGAASVGMGELWLRVLGVPRTDCCFEWSLFDYRMGPIGTLATGAALPSDLEVHGIQIGAGTVGGGFDLAVATLPVHGDLAIADPDFATGENFGAHPLVPAGLTKVAKVELAGAVLRPLERLVLFVRREWYSFFKLRIGGEVPVPDVVISAVDKVRPRHALQTLWAPLHIDLAATAGVQCQVIVRTNPGSGLCLIGFFNAGGERSEEEELAELTGLAADGFDKPTRAVTEEDVRRAPEAKRAALAEALRQGQRWCNVALAATMGATHTDPDFVGAAPHNAILAGLLGVAELVKSRGLGLDRDGTFVQWHAVTRKCLVMQSRCKPNCECAAVTAAPTLSAATT
jgi:hypothetical protein